METSLKTKKFALPRFYVRHNQANLNDALGSEIMDELSPNDYILQNVVNVEEAPASTSKHLDTEVENEVETTVENDVEETEVQTVAPSKAPKASKTSKMTGKKRGERAPSAYNIFIKNTCERLVTTHGNLTAKERYALAIRMWNEQKQVAPATS